MKNIIYYFNTYKKFYIKEVEMPYLKRNYVRVKHLYCGICGGDYSYFIGRRHTADLSLGHEFIAEVIEVDSNIEIFTNGDLVVSDFNYRCGKCEKCVSDQSHLCNYNNIELFSNRAFALYSDIHFSYLTKANLSNNNIASGTCIEPLSCVIHAINSIHLKSNDNILIMGCGNIGTLAAFYLKIILKIENVFVYDIIAEKSEQVINFFKCKEYINHLKIDIIVDASNEVDGLLNALKIATSGSRVCSISHLYGLNVSQAYYEIIRKEIDISFPLRNGNKSNLIIAEQYIRNQWINPYNKMFEIFNLSNINEAFTKKRSSTYNKQLLVMP